MSIGQVFANAVYSDLFDDGDRKLLDEIGTTGQTNQLRVEAKAVGLELDDEDLDALLAYARFLEARRAIQGTHLDQLRKGVDEDVVELPFLFSAGLALPDIETLADVIETKVAS